MSNLSGENPPLKLNKDFTYLYIIPFQHFPTLNVILVCKNSHDYAKTVEVRSDGETDNPKPVIYFKVYPTHLRMHTLGVLQRNLDPEHTCR